MKILTNWNCEKMHFWLNVLCFSWQRKITQTLCIECKQMQRCTVNRRQRNQEVKDSVTWSACALNVRTGVLMAALDAAPATVAKRVSLCQILLSLLPEVIASPFQASTPTLCEWPGNSSTARCAATSHICTTPCWLPIAMCVPDSDHFRLVAIFVCALRLTPVVDWLRSASSVTWENELRSGEDN